MTVAHYFFIDIFFFLFNCFFQKKLLSYEILISRRSGLVRTTYQTVSAGIYNNRAVPRSINQFSSERTSPNGGSDRPPLWERTPRTQNGQGGGKIPTHWSGSPDDGCRPWGVRRFWENYLLTC